jgi:hypothetical protein
MEKWQGVGNSDAGFWLYRFPQGDLCNRRETEKGTKEKEKNVGRMVGKMKGGKGRRKYVKKI